MIQQNARQTKVIKSFEGKALSAAEAEQVAGEEVDVLRLVYSPQAVPALQEFMQTVAKHRTKDNLLPIMLDLSSYTQGLVHGLKQPKELAFGERVVCTPVGAKGHLEISSDDWGRLFAPEATVFIGSGQVALRVLSIRGDKVELEVTQGGVVYPEMEVFVPETRKDPDRHRVTVDELQRLLQTGVDYMTIPGHWPVARVEEFRRELTSSYGDATPWLLAKVDSGAVYERLEELLPHVEGVLISRREMALSLNPATVPMMTKEIIQLCGDQAKLVVTASEMLASMRRNVTPTRAEVSDIANAVLDGTDAVVLSEEVANGKYGAQAVAVTHRIIRDIEEGHKIKPNWIKHAPSVENEMDAIAYNAYRTAERIKAKAIVCVTKAGNTALKLASFRAPVPIIAVTFSQAVLRRLSLVRGVEALMLDIDPRIDEVLPLVNDQLVRGSWLRAGDPIIFVSITLSPIGRESSNLFTVQHLS